MNNHYAILRRERTEALKAKRRIYGDRGGHLHLPFRASHLTLGNAQTSLALLSLNRCLLGAQARPTARRHQQRSDHIR